MWNDFNHGWLGLLQKQKETTDSEQQPQAGQSVISREELEEMGKELVKLCDGVEKHGLVDYEYGVWEEQIIASKLFRRTLLRILESVANSMINSSYGLSRRV